MTARLEMTNNKNIPFTIDVYLDSSLISSYVTCLIFYLRFITDTVVSLLNKYTNF